MKALVIYDSVYGNTEKIAQAVGSALGGEGKVVRVSEANPLSVDAFDMVIIGSPTLGGRPSEPVQNFLAALSETAVKDKKIAAFDTRYSGKFVKLFGYAADRIAESLTAKGGKLVSPPQPFIVTGKKGPLKDGELEKAVDWAKDISK